MDDAVRPSEAAFKAMYARGYRTWATLWKEAEADKHLLQDCLTDLDSSFPNHPYFPEGLFLDKSFSNTILAKGKTTWRTTQGWCDLEPFQEELSENSRVRLYRNPLRILDSKSEQDQKIVAEAPLLRDHLNEASRKFFDEVCNRHAFPSSVLNVNHQRARAR